MSTEQCKSCEIDLVVQETGLIVDSLLEMTINGTVINVESVYDIVKTAFKYLKQIEDGLDVEEAVNFCHCTNNLLVSLIKFFLEKSNNNVTATLEGNIQGSIGTYKDKFQTLNVVLGSMKQEIKNKVQKIESGKEIEMELEIEKVLEKLEKETELTNVKPLTLRGQELLVYINNLGNKFPVGSSAHQIVFTVSSSLEGVLNGQPVPSTILLSQNNPSSMPLNISTTKILTSRSCPTEGGDSQKVLSSSGGEQPTTRDNPLLSGRVIKRQFSALSITALGKLKDRRNNSGKENTKRSSQQRNFRKDFSAGKENSGKKEIFRAKENVRENCGQKENFGEKENPGKENSGKENSGKENSGKENSGKENSGKENPGKENSGKENSGEIVVEIQKLVVEKEILSHEKDTEGSKEEEVVVQQDLLDSSKGEKKEENSGKPENFNKRKFIVEEIINSENSYLEGLKILINVYKYSVIEEGCLTEDEMEQILLPSLAPIFELSQFLVHTFEERLAESGGSFQEMPVGDLFLSVEVELLSRYSPYILDYEQAINNLMKFKKSRPTFSTFLQTLLESPKTKFRNIDDYQITVIQRLPRYVLLLTDLLKHTPRDHQEYEDLSRALEGIKTGVDNLNNEKRINQMRNFGREIVDAFGFDDMASSMLFYEANLFKDLTTNNSTSIQKWQYKILFYDDDQILLIKYKQELLELVKRVSLWDARISQYMPSSKKRKEKDLGSKKAIKIGNTVYYTIGSDVRKQLLQVYTEMLASSLQ